LGEHGAPFMLVAEPGVFVPVLLLARASIAIAASRELVALAPPFFFFAGKVRAARGFLPLAPLVLVASRGLVVPRLFLSLPAGMQLGFPAGRRLGGLPSRGLLAVPGVAFGARRRLSGLALRGLLCFAPCLLPRLVLCALPARSLGGFAGFAHGRVFVGLGHGFADAALLVGREARNHATSLGTGLTDVAARTVTGRLIRAAVAARLVGLAFRTARLRRVVCVPSFISVPLR
jgi:hypothetical protein